MNIWEEIQVNFQNMVQGFTGYIPNIIHAIMVILGGWLIARLIQWIMLRLSHSLGIDRLAQKSGVHKFLEKRGVKNGFSGILSRICFWATMLLVMVSFFNSLGLEIVSDLLNQLTLFIPNVLIASILIIIGFYMAEFVSSLVVSSLEENNFDNPELVGKLVFYCIGFFTIAIALTQIGIGEAIITNIVSIFFGSIGLALAVAFGFGGKDWANEILKKYFSNDDKE